MGESLLFHSNWLRSNIYKVRILIHIPYIEVMLGYFLSFEAFVLLHKHQIKATKTSQAYTVGTHGYV